MNISKRSSFMQTKEKILNAALSLFAEKGKNSLSLSHMFRSPAFACLCSFRHADAIYINLMYFIIRYAPLQQSFPVYWLQFRAIFIDLVAVS